MKRISSFSALLFLLVFLLLFPNCTKDEITTTSNELISSEILNKISKLGFSTEKVLKTDFGYIVEGDIILTEEELNETPLEIRVPNEEQYYTFNLVTRLPRTIKVWVANTLPSSYVSATDDAIDRYNAESLSLNFQRVSSKGGADIQLRPTIPGAGYLAAAGFPTKGGKPYKYIRMNVEILGDNPPEGTLISIIAHEMGHCIGFRHTDWFDRSFSCGGSPVNEGEGSIGAEYIPGTPIGPDAGSFMLSCIGYGDDRPFTTADVTALEYLYGN